MALSKSIQRSNPSPDALAAPDDLDGLTAPNDLPAYGNEQKLKERVTGNKLIRLIKWG